MRQTIATQSFTEPAASMRERLTEVLSSTSPTQNRELIDVLKTNPRLAYLFEQDARIREKYTIEQHTEMVLHQFDRYFPKSLPPECPVTRAEFKLMLALHDIGKSIPEKLSDQVKATCEVVEGVLHELPLRDEAWKILKSVLHSTAIFKYIVSFIERSATLEERDAAATLAASRPLTVKELQEFQKLVQLKDLYDHRLRNRRAASAATQIENEAKDAGIDAPSYYALARMFYCCDTAAYCYDAATSGGVRAKPGLDYLYELHPSADQRGMAPGTILCAREDLNGPRFSADIRSIMRTLSHTIRPPRLTREVLGSHESSMAVSALKKELEEQLKALGPEFAGIHLETRHYTRDVNGLVYFDLGDSHSVHGTTPENIRRALKKIAGLTTADESVERMRATGYRDGYPTKALLPWFDPFTKDHVEEMRSPQGYVPWCLALSPREFGLAAPQQMYLIVADVEDGIHFNHLGYRRCAQAALERNLRKHGIEFPSTEYHLDQREDNEPLQFHVKYQTPGDQSFPSLRTWLHAIEKIPGATRTDTRSFKFDLSKLPGFTPSPLYSSVAELYLQNVTRRMRPKQFQEAACDYFNERAETLGLGVGYLKTADGPLGPNYIELAYGHECKCSTKAEVARKFRQVPGLSKVPNEFETYSLDLSKIPKLAHFGAKTIHLKLTEHHDTSGGWDFVG